MEATADSLLKLRNVRRLVFACHDNRMVCRFREIIGPFGIDVMSLTEAGLPEPRGLARDPLLSVTRNAAVIAGATEVPTIGYARGFYMGWGDRSGFGLSHRHTRAKTLSPNNAAQTIP
jgi:hypothetical protein